MRVFSTSTWPFLLMRSVPLSASSVPLSDSANLGPSSSLLCIVNHKDEAELLDAMIEHRLAAQGKMLIDAGWIDHLRKAVKDLNAALGGLGD